MIEVQIDKQSLKELYVAAAHMEEAIPRHLRTAINKTSKTIRVQIAKKLGRVMVIKNNYPPPELKKAETLKKSIKAKSMATIEKLEARLGFHGGYPFPLKYLNAQPFTKKRKGKKVYSGVKFTNYKKQGQIKRSEYFMVPKFNNHVYVRKGDQPQPIVKVVGPKPGDFFDEIQAIQTARQIAEERLPIEIKRRIREILLEKKGIIKLKTSRGL